MANNIFDVYCDESCHLEKDISRVMVLGALWCPHEETKSIARQFRSLKQQHGLPSSFEAKWVKISPGKIDYYKDVVEYFFSIDSLKFRSVVVPDKTVLNHAGFKQDHDTWYYKMWYVLLKQIISTENSYRIYLDIKDTRSQDKVNTLHDILCSKFHDFEKRTINRIQHVRSHEVELMQIADLLMGALAYLHRNLRTSSAKLSIVEKIQTLSKVSLKNTTAASAQKINLLVWNSREFADAS